MHPIPFAIRYAPESGESYAGPLCKNWACAVLSIEPLDPTPIDAMLVNGQPHLLDKPVPAMHYLLQNWKIAQAMRDAIDAALAPPAIAVWQINDMEYWVGAGTPESILAAYTASTGVLHEDATGDEGTWPSALDDEALDRLQFSDTDENESPIGGTRSFREQLAIEIANGGEFPRMFAANEW